MTLALCKAPSLSFIRQIRRLLFPLPGPPLGVQNALLTYATPAPMLLSAHFFVDAGLKA